MLQHRRARRPRALLDKGVRPDGVALIVMGCYSLTPPRACPKCDEARTRLIDTTQFARPKPTDYTDEQGDPL